MKLSTLWEDFLRSIIFITLSLKIRHCTRGCQSGRKAAELISISKLSLILVQISKKITAEPQKTRENTLLVFIFFLENLPTVYPTKKNEQKKSYVIQDGWLILISAK